MKEALVNQMCCPFCSEGFFLEILRLDLQKAEEVEEGLLVCKGCGRRYCITRGIPRILTPSLFHLFDSALFRERYTTAFASIIDSHRSQASDDSSLNVDWNIAEMGFWDTKYKLDFEDERTSCEFDINNAPYAHKSWQNRLVPRERAIFRHIRDKIDSQSCVLEIGCGKTITISNLLNPKDYDFSYIGTDLSSHALELSKKFVKCDFIQCPAESLPLKNQSVDVLLGFGCLEHIPGHEMNIPILLNKIKNGGYFGIQEALGIPKGLSRFFPILKKMSPEESPHEENINIESAVKYLKSVCEIIEVEFEASAIQTWMMYLFGPVASRSAKVYRIVELIDKATINTLGRLFPMSMFDKGVVTLLAKKCAEEERL